MNSSSNTYYGSFGQSVQPLDLFSKCSTSEMSLCYDIKHIYLSMIQQAYISEMERIYWLCSDLPQTYDNNFAPAFCCHSDYKSESNTLPTYSEVDSKQDKLKSHNSKKLDIKPYFDLTLKSINNGELTNVYGSGKAKDESRPNFSKRRSTYIGVSKNGANWQVLINIKNVKRYISTYPTQKEAAIVYDLYAIAVHGSAAKTNFDYDSELICEMIQNFYLNGNKFKPSSFVDRV